VNEPLCRVIKDPKIAVEILVPLTFYRCPEFPQSNNINQTTNTNPQTRFIMCFGSSSKEEYSPPRRVEYGKDYNRYVRDYDKYQKSYAKGLEHDRKKAARRSRNRVTAGVVAGAAAGGGGGGC
jgi:hypothetical protein